MTKMKIKKEQPQLEVFLKPSVDIETITPEIAEDILKNNKKNRPLKEDHVRFYQREMSGNKWIFNGESIKICEDGNLMDGQHRLSAIIKSGLTQDCVVVRNLVKEAFSTIDTGRKRHARDILAIEGYQYYMELASAAKIIKILNVNVTMPQGAFKKSSRDISIDETVEVVKNDPQVYECLLYSMRFFPELIQTVGKTIVHALFYLFSKKDKELALEMFTLLNSRAIGNPNSVLLQCSNLLIIHRREQKTHRAFDMGYRICLLIRTWNLLRNGVADERLVQDYSLPLPVIE